MLDKYNRNIDYLRISITDRCNLRCQYCMPEEGVTSLSHEEILTYDEIIRLARIGAGLGIRKIKVTGGEPLVRKNCPWLIRQLKALPGIEKVTLTTNGVLLSQYLPDLSDAGLDAINISLDTLSKERFEEITRRDELDKVLEGIHSAIKYSEIPLKINCVPVMTDRENICSMAAMAKDYPLHVRFIEMMPIGLGKGFKFRGEDEILQILEDTFGPMTPASESLGNGPGHYYNAEGFKGKIGFISAMTHQFCHKCNRVRLTSEGRLKACLQYRQGADLRSLLRNSASDEEIRETMRQVIWDKPVGHSFSKLSVEDGEAKAMSQIGG